MPVEVQQEEVAPCRVALTIQVPPEEGRRAVDDVFSQVARRTAVPGFRPGKAPRQLLKRFIDEEHVRQLALERAIERAFREAIRAKGLEPYPEGEPEVQLLEESPDLEKGFAFKATLSLRPRVELAGLEGLRARRAVVAITDADVDKEIRSRLAANPIRETVEGPSEEGDELLAVIEVSVDGRVLPELSRTEPQIVTVGQSLPEFNQALLGVKAGEETSFEFTIPEDWHEEPYRGARATARVRVLEVRRPRVPEPSDEAAQRLGYESLEAMRTRVREELEEAARQQAEQEMERELLQEVTRCSTVEFPEEMLEQEAGKRLAERIQAVESSGISFDRFLQDNRMDLATFQAQLRREVREDLKQGLVVRELIRRFDLRVTDREVEEELRRTAEAQNLRLSDVRRVFREAGLLDRIRTRLMMRKVYELLKSRATIEEVTL